MIHLVNGDSTLATLKESSVPGEKFSADDILMEGPILDGLRSDSSWEIRAEYLERCFSIPAARYRNGKSEKDRLLHEALIHDEIVLWFGPDLFCQANLLYLLDWFASTDMKHSRLSLVSPWAFPEFDPFRCLGELTASQLESLFARRREVTPELWHTGQSAWQAFGSSDPRTIQHFLASDTSSLPSLAPALRAHLMRFPSVANGLGILGQKIFEILASQPLDLRRLFPSVTTTPEIFRHGMGDLQLKSYLKMWSLGPAPLIQGNSVYELTAAGHRVLNGSDDAIRLNGIDLWYGGVHLTADNPWRWDSRQEEVALLRRSE